MCIAIASPRGVNPPLEKYLKNSFESNPDGAGFAFNHKGKVVIVKGLMTWNDFINTFNNYKSKYDFTNSGLLIHFRIQTHGGVNPQCCHPFPITASKTELHALKTTCEYAIVHNGIISLTCEEANRQTKNGIAMSDTMVFVEKYMAPLVNSTWFNNASTWSLLYKLAASKLAGIDGDGNINVTDGFEKDEVGNLYSNGTYKMSYKDYLYDYYHAPIYSKHRKKGDDEYVSLMMIPSEKCYKPTGYFYTVDEPNSPYYMTNQSLFMDSGGSFWLSPVMDGTIPNDYWENEEVLSNLTYYGDGGVVVKNKNGEFKEVKFNPTHKIKYEYLKG